LFNGISTMTDDIRKAWDDVRSDSSAQHWVVLKASADLKGVELAATGTTGFDDFLQKFDGAETAMWGGMRIRAVDNRGTVKSVRAKFVKLNLLPDSMPVLKRAKAGQLKSQVDELLTGTHAAFDISDVKDLTKKVVEKQLQATCGAHQPSYYDFDGSTGEDAGASAVPAKSMSSSVDASAASPTSPAAAEDAAKAPEAAASASTTPTQPAAVTSPTTPVPTDIASTWKAVQSDSDKLNWVALTYDGKDVKSVTVHAAGFDGLDGLRESLDDDLVVYAALRVTAIDDRGSVKSVRAKYIFVQYIGSGVKPLVRAQAGPMKSHFENILTGTHISVNISTPAELTPDLLEKRLQATCGAHQPNRYEFGTKIVSVADF
jgi:hypothetical protein